MKINVLFFGLVHDLTGRGEEQVEVPDGEKLEDLCRKYERRFPRLKEVRESLLTAVNQEIVERSWPLRDGDEVAFLPPVSGGSPEPLKSADFYRITRQAIPTAELARELKAPEQGAVVVFEGIVRDNLHGRKTRHLEYEAYEPMAIRKMEQIGHATPADATAGNVEDADFGALLPKGGKLPAAAWLKPLSDAEREKMGLESFQAKHGSLTTTALVFLDPWGNPYVYREWASVPDALKKDQPHATERFVIYSLGPNGRDDQGEGDDIASWKKD